MKYISLFSGIGGFEVAVHNILHNAECIGFSEVDKFALQVYQSHFSSHRNLGDIRTITQDQRSHRRPQGL
jgi:DNA (cytosine-5)-methyltransferase 1